MRHPINLEVYYSEKIMMHKTNMQLAKDHGDFEAFRYYSKQLLKYLKLLKSIKKVA